MESWIHRVREQGIAVQHRPDNSPVVGIVAATCFADDKTCEPQGVGRCELVLKDPSASARRQNTEYRL